MIEGNVYAERWRVLANRFNRDLDPEEANRYYRYLSPRLDTAQFVAASEHLWAESARFPKPKDFVDAAPASATKALPSEGDRDPYHQPIKMVLRGSVAHREWEATVDRRRKAGIPVEDDTGPPYFFPRVCVEIVETPEEVGLGFIDRPDLRSLTVRYAGGDET